MTIQQLSVFLAVCEDGNYTRAAARVYMSRQAVRQNIDGLERELGGPLFENRRNHPTLTAKGKLLRAHAEPLVREFLELQRVMNADISPGRALNLGVSVALVPNYLPRLEDYLTGFTENYPKIRLSTLQTENDEAPAAVLAGALAACLVLDTGGLRAGLRRTVLTRHPLAVLMRSRAPAARAPALNAADLTGGPLFVPGLGEEFRPLFDALSGRGAAVDCVVMPSFYQVLFHILDHDGMAINRLDPRDRAGRPDIRNLPLRDMPPLCCSFLWREGDDAVPLQLLCDWLAARLREEFMPHA